jgi:hypothetical protein
LKVKAVKSISINITLSPLCLSILDDLQTEHNTNNRSEMIEWLVLSQKHSKTEVERLLKDRPKRGRRWPKEEKSAE